MKRLAGALDLKFDLSSEAPAVSPVERPALPAEPTAPEPLDAPPGAALVLAIGRRAREISRHIGEPGWVSGDVRGELHDQTRLIHVMNADDPRALEKLAAAYDVVVALADDRINGTRLTSRQRAVLERTERLGTLRILAPALPEDHPARSLVSSHAVHRRPPVQTSSNPPPGASSRRRGRRRACRDCGPSVRGSGSPARCSRPAASDHPGTGRPISSGVAPRTQSVPRPWAPARCAPGGFRRASDFGPPDPRGRSTHEAGPASVVEDRFRH